MSYSGTPTTYGEQKIAAALASGQPLTVVAVAVGDGGGSPVAPSEGQTALTHEVWRGNITSWGVDPADTRRIVVHVTVPATAGPFVVREAGVYDGAGGLICVTALAATEAVGPGSSNQATSIDLIIAMPIGSAGAITVSPTAGERFTIERLYRTPFISINSASTTAPPANPSLGDLYIMPAGASGAWANAGTGTIAEWNGTFWAFLAPPVKMVAGIMDAGDAAAPEYLKWNGSIWEAFAGAGCIFTVVDTAGASTADELVGTTLPGLTALQPNMIFRWRKGATANATAVPHGNVSNSANVALGDVPFTKADASPLAAGDLPANADFLTEYDATGPRHRVLGMRLSDVAVFARPRLSGPALFFVDPVNGSDVTGDGSAGKPWKTRQKAWNTIVTTLDLGGNNAKVSLLPGTFTDTFLATSPAPGNSNGVGAVLFQGVVASPGAVTVATTGVNAWTGQGGAQFSIDSIGLQTVGTNTIGIASGVGAVIGYSNILFGPCVLSQVSCSSGGFTQQTGPCSIIGDAPSHVAAGGAGSNATMAGETLTFSGTRSFSNALLYVQGPSQILANAMTYAGAAASVAGKAYSVQGPGFLFLNGSAPPGSAAGVNNGGYVVP